MIDAYGYNIDHLRRWDRVRLVDDPEPGREHPHSKLGSRGSLVAVTGNSPYQEPDILILAIKTDQGPLVEVRSDQVVEDDEAAAPDVQAELDQASWADRLMNDPRPTG